MRLIDADALIAEYDRVHIGPVGGARKLMVDAPTVDAIEVVHGEWIFNRGQAYGEPLYFCSVCTDGGSEWGTDKYCPNCGAKMDGGVNKDAN